VDNAVKHGISKLTSGGEIAITVKAQNGELEIEIRDNGPGFLKEGTLPTNGVGLRITRERLESLYGQDQSVELLDLLGRGTVTRVCIPFRMQSSDGEHDTRNRVLRRTG
jgi:sensor histidine kinase YesM